MTEQERIAQWLQSSRKAAAATPATDAMRHDGVDRSIDRNCCNCCGASMLLVLRGNTAR